MTSTGLHVSGLHVAFAGLDPPTAAQRGLFDVNLNVSAGSIVVLVGANGSGKSTLLRALAGYLPSIGAIAIDGRRIDGMPAWERARSITYIDQHRGIGLPEHLQVADVLALWATRGCATLTRPLRSPRLRHGREALTQLAPHLSNRLSDPIGSLSGGEQQLLSLACLATALTLGASESRMPGLLLLDEHTASLDPDREHAVFAATRELVIHHRLAALAVCHDEEVVDQWADDVVLIQRDGHLSRRVGDRKSGWLRREIAGSTCEREPSVCTHRKPG